MVNALSTALAAAMVAAAPPRPTPPPPPRNRYPPWHDSRALAWVAPRGAPQGRGGGGGGGGGNLLTLAPHASADTTVSVGRTTTVAGETTMTVAVVGHDGAVKCCVCNGATNIRIPEAVTSIEDRAFAGCYALQAPAKRPPRRVWPTSSGTTTRSTNPHHDAPQPLSMMNCVINNEVLCAPYGITGL